MKREHTYLIAKSVATLISAMGMHAENMQRAHRGESMAYDSDSFEKLVSEAGLGENQILRTLNGESQP